MNLTSGGVLGLVFFLLAAGCRSTWETQGSVELAAPLPVARRQRSVAAETTTARIDYIAAHSRKPLVQPAYPQGALGRGAGRYVLYVTFTVDENGGISDIRPSAGRIRFPNPYSDLFFQAAVDTILKWKMEAARRVYWQKVSGEDDRYIKTETASESMEMMFVFDASLSSRR